MYEIITSVHTPAYMRAYSDKVNHEHICKKNIFLSFENIIVGF